MGHSPFSDLSMMEKGLPTLRGLSVVPFILSRFLITWPCLVNIQVTQWSSNVFCVPRNQEESSSTVNNSGTVCYFQWPHTTHQWNLQLPSSTHVATYRAWSALCDSVSVWMQISCQTPTQEKSIQQGHQRIKCNAMLNIIYISSSLVSISQQLNNMINEYNVLQTSNI